MGKSAKKEYLKLGKTGKGKTPGRAERRRKIKRKIEEKLVESEFKRRETRERKRHGSLLVKEIETIDGRERLAAGIEGSGAGPELFGREAFPARISPEELALIEKSLAGSYPKSRELLAAIEKDAGIELFEAQMRTIEEEATELVEAYGIDGRRLRERIEKSAVKKLGAEAGTLLDLVELDRKLSKELLYKPASPDPGLPYFERQKERITEIAEQAETHFLIFDAALAYAFIAISGKTSPVQLGERLGMEKSRVKACVSLLKEQGLIEARKTHGKGEELTAKERHGKKKKASKGGAGKKKKRKNSAQG